MSRRVTNYKAFRGAFSACVCRAPSASVQRMENPFTLPKLCIPTSPAPPFTRRGKVTAYAPAVFCSRGARERVLRSRLCNPVNINLSPASARLSPRQVREKSGDLLRAGRPRPARRLRRDAKKRGCIAITVGKSDRARSFEKGPVKLFVRVWPREPRYLSDLVEMDVRVETQRDVEIKTAGVRTGRRRLSRSRL